MEILGQCRDYAVCIKPVGADSEKEMPALLSEQLGGDFYPVHRLDLNVGGVMVYARNSRAAALFSEEIREGTFRKEYVARVHGMPPQKGEWEDLLYRDRKLNKTFVVRRMRSGVKPARLSFVRLSEEEPALVRIRLYTGRSHQIRVQFASRGYPLMGDHKYGARDEEKAPMLFSCRLEFPWEGKACCFESFPHWAAPEQK